MAFSHLLISILWLSLVSLALLTWCRQQNKLRLVLTSACAGVTALAATIAFAVIAATFFAAPLWGLEYEDAYEYEYAARFLAYGDSPDGPSLNPLCVDGALADCASVASLPHPLGVSSLAAWVVPLTEALDVQSVPISSIVMFAVVGVLVFTLAHLSGGRNIATALALALFVGAWRVSAHFGTGFAEPFAAALLLLAVVAAYWLTRTAGSARADSLLVGGVLAVSVALAVLCKREMLAPALTLGVCVLAERSKRSNGMGSRAADSRWTAGTIALGTLLGALVGGATPLALEAASPVERWPFSLANVIRHGPAYLTWLLSSQALVVGLLLAGVAAAFPRSRTLAAWSLALTGSLMLLFVAFDHDYGTVVEGRTPIHHFDRYSLQFLPVLAVAGGLGGEALLEKLMIRRERNRVWATRLAGLLLLIVAAASSWNIHTERMREHREERFVRLDPARTACEHLDPSATVLTYEPVVLGIVCAPTRRLIDVTALGTPGLESDEIRLRSRQGALYLLEPARGRGMLAERYPQAADVLEQLSLTDAAGVPPGLHGQTLLRVRAPRAQTAND